MGLIGRFSIVWELVDGTPNFRPRTAYIVGSNLSGEAFCLPHQLIGFLLIFLKNNLLLHAHRSQARQIAASSDPKHEFPCTDVPFRDLVDNWPFGGF